jgi:D-aminopeptidase
MSERWRGIAGEAGLAGTLAPGPLNAITDVPGVRVGHARAASGERTGVSVIAPPQLPATAGVACLNGTGELCGYLEVAERGLIETAVYLCGTHAIGTVIDAAVSASGRGADDVVIPIVGECDDGELADARTVVAADVENALAALAGGPVAEGNVGAGSGMSCFDFPGGIGTASRALGFGGHHLGVLLLCNFGDRERLDLLGNRLGPAAVTSEGQGSCIAICATDAPLGPIELRRLALRPLLGIARAGSHAAEGSGEIGLAFGAAPPGAADGAIGRERLDRCFVAAYEAAHEAVFNCLVAARPAERRDGRRQDAFPVELARRMAEERR